MIAKKENIVFDSSDSSVYTCNAFMPRYDLSVLSSFSIESLCLYDYDGFVSPGVRLEIVQLSGSTKSSRPG